MIEIDELVLVRDLTFCLFWPDTAIERLDVTHGALEEMGSARYRGPFSHLNI